MKRALLFLLLCFVPVPSFATGAFVNKIVASVGASGGTTGSVNMSGANLLVAYTSRYSGGGASAPVSDSNSNTWTAIPSASCQDATSGVQVEGWYSKNPTVGSMTFTLGAPLGSNFVSIAVYGFSGADTSAPLDQANCTPGTAITSIQTGSITPSANNYIVVTGVSIAVNQSGSEAVNSSMSSPDIVDLIGGVSEGIGAAYQIQTTATARNPTWSWTNASGAAAAIVSFKTTGGAAASHPRFFLLPK